MSSSEEVHVSVVTNKPLCDGTHSKIGFAAAERAVKAADAEESPQ